MQECRNPSTSIGGGGLNVEHRTLLLPSSIQALHRSTSCRLQKTDKTGLGAPRRQLCVKFVRRRRPRLEPLRSHRQRHNSGVLGSSERQIGHIPDAGSSCNTQNLGPSSRPGVDECRGSQRGGSQTCGRFRIVQVPWKSSRWRTQ